MIVKRNPDSILTGAVRGMEREVRKMIKHIPDGFEGFNPDRVLELMQEAVDYVNDLPYVDLYDIEIEMTVNAGQIALEWVYNRLNQPSEYGHISCAQYFDNCMTRNGGTLEMRKWSEEF